MTPVTEKLHRMAPQTAHRQQGEVAEECSKPQHAPSPPCPEDKAPCYPAPTPAPILLPSLLQVAWVTITIRAAPPLVFIRGICPMGTCSPEQNFVSPLQQFTAMHLPTQVCGSGEMVEAGPSYKTSNPGGP